jgi:hypothetical protein
MAIPNPQVISTVDTVSDQRLDINGTVWQLSTNTNESVILYGITDSAGTAYEIGYLKERPAALNFYGSNAAPAVSGETEVTTLGTIASTKFYVDYDRAFMLFPDGHSTPVSVTYKGMGSIQKAKDVNEAIRAGIFSTQNYLGSYASASAPSVDRIGATLIDGALYYNTTDNVLMTYDLGGTTWNRTTPTSTEQGHINTVSGIAANVSTVAVNIVTVNDFADRYRIASSDPSSANNDGDLVWNTTSLQLKIYNATTSAWVAPYVDSAAVTTIASNEAVAMSIALG